MALTTLISLIDSCIQKNIKLKIESDKTKTLFFSTDLRIQNMVSFDLLCKSALAVWFFLIEDAI